MRTATDRTWDLFLESVLDDGDRGYPSSVAFVSIGTDNFDEIVWRNLRDETPTVVIDEDALEIMFVPIHRTGPVAWINRARGRVYACIVWRKHGAEHEVRMPPVRMNRKSIPHLYPTPAVAPA